jgi:Fe-S-cluster containining protein
MPVEEALSANAGAESLNRLYPDDRFTFECGPHLDCFRQCCRDVTIVLTPYDILRLKRALGIDSGEFLEKHTLSPPLPEQKFPIVILKMEGESRQCPFLDANGCSVYADRPWSCRMYPLGCAEPKNPTPEQRPFHFVIREDLCHGHETGRSQQVREWLRDQGIEEFEMMGASFKDLTLNDFWGGEKGLTEEQADMFYMACYDLDRFRRFVFETRFLQLLDVEEARIEALRTDDEELLEFGAQWLRFALFHERTMKLRRPAESAI